jgi:phosphate transporter family protein
MRELRSRIRWADPYLEVATLVATRAARPLQAVILASVCNVLGPLVVGAAVADTIGGIVTLTPAKAIQVIGAGLLAAVGWNVVTWFLGLPSGRFAGNRRLREVACGASSTAAARGWASAPRTSPSA